VPDTPDAPDVVTALQWRTRGCGSRTLELQAENAELKAQLAEQAEKITRLERRIFGTRGTLRCRRAPMTSRDSSGRNAGRAERPQQ